MKKAITIYKQFYDVPEEVSNSSVISHMVVVTLFFFTLGFTVSQFIIFILR